MKTKSILLALVAAGGIGIFGASAASAMSVDNGSAIVGALKADSLVQDARLYCHRGPVFLHWGPCGGVVYRWRPRYYRYRVYRYWRYR